MTSQIVLLFVILILKISNGVLINFSRSSVTSHLGYECGGEKNLTEIHGILTSPNYPNQYPDGINCSWIIKPPQNNNNPVITVVVVTDVDIFNCTSTSEKCCANNALTISRGTTILKKFCGGKERLPLTISAGDATIGISFTSTIKNVPRKRGFRLIFSARDKNHCEDYDLSCYDKRGCYNAIDICDSLYKCSDHSDEINCAKCKNNEAPCNFHTHSCFNPMSQRCDGIVDCPNGEDEMDCPKICSDKLPCQNGRGCYGTNQICDGTSDCSDDSDEIDCTPSRICRFPIEHNKRYFVCNNRKCIDSELVANGVNDCGDFSDELTSNKQSYKIFFLIAISLYTVFMMTICRWCTTRRDLRRFMENLPEFPLPPYRGPGDNGRLMFSESDFLHGGEIYEAFVNTRDRLNVEVRRSRTSNAPLQRQRQVFTNSNPSCAVNALASLGITPGSCISLDNTDFLRGCGGPCEVCKKGRNESEGLSGFTKLGNWCTPQTCENIKENVLPLAHFGFSSTFAGGGEIVTRIANKIHIKV